ncbi:MAG: SpoIIE family protein phosphatase [Acidobacteriota bacterium]|nr:SpoIIE family protein phosphatase [Acidobacteriota bacterium]
MTNRLRLVLGTLFFVLMFVQLAAVATLPLRGSYDGWSSRWTDGQPTIISVDRNGPATDLQVGDIILAINGVNPKKQSSILNLSRSFPAGTIYTMTIRRNQQQLELVLATAPLRINWLSFATFALINLLFWLIGLTVFVLKPNDKQAFLLALMLGTYTAVNGSNIDGLPSGLIEIVRFGKLVGLWFVPIFVHFFLYFPERSPLLKRFPKILLFVYVLFLIFVLPGFAIERVSPGIAAWLRSTWLLQQRWYGMLGMIVLVGLLFFGLVVLAINYRAASLTDRRRLRVVAAGSGAGFLNLFLMPLGEFFGLKDMFPTVWGFLGTSLVFTLPLVPLSFAYAIIRHQVIPVSLMIRRGVRYLLVSRGSVLIEAVIVILTVTAVLTYLFSRFKPSGIVIGTVSAAVAILVWKLEGWLHEKYLAPIIDRKFFRESYNSHQIIADLTDSLRSTASLPQLCREVATKIQSALKTENVTVLLRDEATGNYVSGYSCEFNSANGQAAVCQQPFRLRRDSLAVARLIETAQPLEADSFDDEDLRQMKSALLLPLATRQEMPGIVSLGARLGDLPFSGEDKALLMSAAGPTTFAIENSRLVERMIEEARRREEIEAENQQRAKELEEARQLQISMLPKSIPQLPHLEIAAYMKTATEVGGDYYDFHLSASGELTIVVGDATGHGLKAGTVVTATKSLFNHLAETADVTEFFSHSSRALKQMNMRSLFMAMTVARISGSSLTLSSAGMPPVLIYRAAISEVEEIQLTGVPLGSVKEYRYRQQTVGIASGDVIVLMSDGLPERFNPFSEMLGYDQPKLALAESAGLSAQSIIERMLTDADDWAKGRPLDDDVTFVVVKVR